MTEGRKRAVAKGVKFGPKFKLNSFQKQEALAVWQQVRASQLSPRRMASTRYDFALAREGGSPPT